MSLNVELIEKSFDRIRPCADEFSASFYENLFTDCPEARNLFARIDMEGQQKKLALTLVMVVDNIRYPDYLTQALQDLGERHVRYQTLEEHYPIVGAALLKTFESYLGAEWTDEVKQAWVEAYESITQIMLDGAARYGENAAAKRAQQATQPSIINRNLSGDGTTSLTRDLTPQNREPTTARRASGETESSSSAWGLETVLIVLGVVGLAIVAFLVLRNRNDRSGGDNSGYINQTMMLTSKTDTANRLEHNPPGLLPLQRQYCELQNARSLQHKGQPHPLG